MPRPAVPSATLLALAPVPLAPFAGCSDAAPPPSPDAGVADAPSLDAVNGRAPAVPASLAPSAGIPRAVHPWRRTVLADVRADPQDRRAVADHRDPQHPLQ